MFGVWWLWFEMAAAKKRLSLTNLSKPQKKKINSPVAPMVSKNALKYARSERAQPYRTSHRTFRIHWNVCTSASKIRTTRASLRSTGNCRRNGGMFWLKGLPGIQIGQWSVCWMSPALPLEASCWSLQLPSGRRLRQIVRTGLWKIYQDSAQPTLCIRWQWSEFIQHHNIFLQRVQVVQGDKDEKWLGVPTVLLESDAMIVKTLVDKCWPIHINTPEFQCVASDSECFARLNSGVKGPRSGKMILLRLKPNPEPEPQGPLSEPPRATTG